MKFWQRREIGVLSLGGGVFGFSVGVSQIFTQSSVVAWALGSAFVAVYVWGG